MCLRRWPWSKLGALCDDDVANHRFSAILAVISTMFFDFCMARVDLPINPLVDAILDSR